MVEGWRPDGEESQGREPWRGEEDDEPGQPPAPESGIHDPATRRKLVRRAGLYTIGLFLAAVVVAAAGGALLGWFLARLTGMSFLRSWLIAGALVLGLPLLGQLVRELVQRRRGG